MPPKCSADAVEAVRALLVNAPKDRAWRRRGFIVMLRARASNVNTADDVDAATQGEDGGLRKVARTETWEGPTITLKGAVSWLINLEIEGVLRTVVHFL